MHRDLVYKFVPEICDIWSEESEAKQIDCVCWSAGQRTGTFLYKNEKLAYITYGGDGEENIETFVVLRFDDVKLNMFEIDIPVSFQGCEIVAWFCCFPKKLKFL